MITRYLLASGLTVAILGAVYLTGRAHESAEWRVKLAEAREESRKEKDELEAFRLAQSAELDQLHATLQFEAMNEPDPPGACAMPVERLRRLDALR